MLGSDGLPRKYILGADVSLSIYITYLNKASSDKNHRVPKIPPQSFSYFIISK